MLFEEILCCRVFQNLKPYEAIGCLTCGACLWSNLYLHFQFSQVLEIPMANLKLYGKLYDIVTHVRGHKENED